MSVKGELDHSEDTKKSMQGYKALNVRLNKEINTLKATIASHDATESNRVDAVVEKASTIDTETIHNQKFKRAPWLPVCEGSECGTKNPKWKDETECKDCKYPLGAVETLPDIDSCPGCSKKGTEFSAVRKNEQED